MTQPPSPNTLWPGGPSTYPWEPQQPQAVQVPAVGNIDPNANVNRNTGGVGQQPYGPTTTPTLQAQAGAQQAGQTPPAVGAPQGPNGMFTPDQTTSQAAQEVQQSNLNVAASWDAISKQQALVDRMTGGDLQVQVAGNPAMLQDATSTLNTLYNNLATAEQRVQTANAAYGSALHNAVVDPSQVNLQTASANKAQNDADYAAAQAKVLTDGAPTQRALAAAQAGYYSAQAVAQQAAADATTAKTPAEVQQLQAQASQYNAQAAQTNALIPGLVQKQQADISLTQSQAGLTDSQSDYYKANAAKTTADAGLVQAQTDYQRAATSGLLPAQVQQTQAQAGLAGAQGTNQLAQAAGQLATVQQNLQGSLYGLQDRVNAIRAIQQQVFGPGGSGDPSEANDLLNQFVTSSIAGTTPYAANVAAANAGLTAFGTQASMYNAAQQALASRANALAGLGGNVLSTLGQMNANAPKGSTAMAGAFQNVIDYLANKTAAQQQAGVPGGMPQQPTPPPLPPLLQRLAGQAPTGAAGAPLPTSPPGAAAGVPTAPFNPQASTMAIPPQQPQTSAPVTINIGGGQNPSPGPAQQFPQGTPQTQPMPAALQQYAPPTADFVHQLWGNELQSGAVQSPYNQGPGPGTPAAGSLYY